MKANVQQQAIFDFDPSQSLLVIAGAGSGKTTIISRKAIAIASTLKAHEHIQMLTFSNKAAAEMKERVMRVNGSLPSNIAFDTFHSYGLKLLKLDPRGFGLSDGFTLLSDTDVKRSVRALAKDYGVPKAKDSADKKRLDPMNWLNTWSLLRQAGYNVNNTSKNKAHICETLLNKHGLSSGELEVAWNTLTAYEDQKRLSSSVDFDDLLYLPLLRAHEDSAFLSLIKSNVAHVIVDEMQDTNRIQYELISAVAKDHCAVTMVGDDDQSIYGWRGAEVSNLHRFKRQFKAHSLPMEENFRSTQCIVNLATRLIKHNSTRLDKTPFSKGAVGEDPYLFEYSHSREMAAAIAENIRKKIDSGVDPADIAILYRTNRMAMLLEPALRNVGIDYHVVGGMSLFDRSEVVAAVSAVRLASNGRDINALKSAVNFIDGFGDASCYSVCDWILADEGASLHDLPSTIPGVSAARLEPLTRFLADIQDEILLAESAKEFLKWVIDGPMNLLERERDDQIRERKSQHLCMLADNVDHECEDRRRAGERISWRDIFIEISLRNAGQSQSNGAQITLSTLHRSKGLEYPYVLLVGMSEGLLPLDNRSDDADDSDAAFSHIEEERRLAFVGLTRAELECEFYHSDQYGFPGGSDQKIYKPSRFLEEMGYQPCPRTSQDAMHTASTDYEDELESADDFCSALKLHFR